MDLTFESMLAVPPERAWAWATSVRGVTTELAPWLRMTAPRGFERLVGDDVPVGRPLFRSYVFLLGILPIDRSDLTLVELEPGRRFQEQSPMLSMKLWRHERTIFPTADGCRVRDHLEFEPRFARRLVGRFIEAVFTHRHAVLRAQLGTAG